MMGSGLGKGDGELAEKSHSAESDRCNGFSFAAWYWIYASSTYAANILSFPIDASKPLQLLVSTDSKPRTDNVIPSSQALRLTDAVNEILLLENSHMHSSFAGVAVTTSLMQFSRAERLIGRLARGFEFFERSSDSSRLNSVFLPWTTHLTQNCTTHANCCYLSLSFRRGEH